MHTSPGGPISAQQFYRQSADETLGPWVDVRGKQDVCFYLTSNGVTSSGVISLEECAPEDVSIQPNTPFGASTDGYSLITTQTASTISGGKQIAIHLQVRAYCYVRARISTAIGGGGTVSANCVAY